jgi:hypothetical protein
VFFYTWDAFEAVEDYGTRSVSNLGESSFSMLSRRITWPTMTIVVYLCFHLSRSSIIPHLL